VGEPRASPHPNILLITCHDMGRFLGCYGVETVATPNLDRLAATGVRLASAFTTAPSCSPARAAMATGRYPHANGLMGLTHAPFAWDLHSDERHIAQILGEAGYDTHLFGFQHVSPDDARPGFGHIHGGHGWGLAGPVADKVAALLGTLQDIPHPFYLEVNIEEPHRPYDQGGALPDASRGVTVPGYLPAGEESEREMAAFQGAVAQADRAIGRILAELQVAGLDNHTCVVFAGDHGIAMPRAKCTLYDPGLEIAMLLRCPAGGVAGGAVLDELVSSVDLLPTLLELAGISAPANIQGRSFAPALRGEPHTPRSMIFAEKTYHSYYDPMRAVRTNRFKYIRNFEPAPAVEIPADIARGAIFAANVAAYISTQHVPEELYDLHTDPLEQRNLAGDPDCEETRASLREHLITWMRDTDDPLIDGLVPLPVFPVDAHR
jgi:arylsulfatase A-like enzyme